MGSVQEMFLNTLQIVKQHKMRKIIIDKLKLDYLAISYDYLRLFKVKIKQQSQMGLEWFTLD